MRVKFFMLSVLTLALVGCGEDKVSTKSVVDRADAAGVKNLGVITVSKDPSAEISCEGSVVNVKWDASKAGVTKDKTEVQIWVQPVTGEPVLFVEGGVVGQAKTGSWISPGVKIVAKMKSDKSIVDEFVVAGKKC
ncbi:hypothetical protein DKY63_26900 [Pseudomonas putida]|uniref:Lipoprotein n=2 Tax=Pseudomonas putida TaxID=303 RepID=A0A2Z4RQG0_PSEPU|nr:hypothetical protein DKY63_26900 [Pseudomonas putida]